MMKKSNCAIMLLACPIVCFGLNFFIVLPCIFFSVFHFCVIGFLIDKKQIKWITAILFSLLYPVSGVIAYACKLLIRKDFSADNFWTFVVLAGVYELVCAAMILINVAIRQKMHDEKKRSSAIVIESVVVLAVFALAPLLTLQIDWPKFLDWYGAMVLYVMGWGIGMLSTFSFALGCMMRRRLITVKLLVWCIAVVAAVYLNLVFVEDGMDFSAPLHGAGLGIWILSLIHI